MGTRFQATACPLCADEFDDPAEFRDHLAFMHDLVDDEGAETTLPEAPPEPPAPPSPVVVGPQERVEPVPYVAPAVAHASLTEPVALRLDRRVLPGLVAAVVLQLVVALLGLAVVDGGSPDRVTAAAGSGTAASEDDAGGDHAEAGAPASAGGSATPAPPTTAAPKVDTGNDQARADAITVRAGDLPAGWRVFDPGADSGGDAATDGGPECTAANDPTDTDSLTGEAYSGFVHDISAVIGGAMVLSTEKDAIRTMAVLRELTQCLGDQMLAGAEAELSEGLSMTHGSFSSLGYPTYGDETIASSMPVTIAGPGGRIPLRADVLAIRRDRAVAFIMVMTGANDFTPQQERGMLSAIADRMSPRAV
jgi:hypothetical protein